jgi:predicted RNase H-like HicB family nuclease
MVSISRLTSSPTDSSQLTYNVLIEKEQDGTFSAITLGLLDYKSSGKTENEAVEKLQQLLQARLKNSKIVTLAIESPQLENPQSENPWTKIAGMYKDNPLVDEVIAEIEAERYQLDKKMEEYYEQLDIEDELG